MAPKKIKTIKGHPAVQVKRKLCATHGTPMQYAPERVRWECTMDGCKKVSYPPDSDGDITKPIIGRGEVELVIIDNQVLLRTSGNNVCIDITKIMNQGTSLIRSEMGGDLEADVNLHIRNVVTI